MSLLSSSRASELWEKSCACSSKLNGLCDNCANLYSYIHSLEASNKELEQEQIKIMEEQTIVNLRYIEELKKRDEKLRVCKESLEFYMLDSDNSIVAKNALASLTV